MNHSIKDKLGLVIYAGFAVFYVVFPILFAEQAEKLLFSKSPIIIGVVFIAFCIVGYINVKEIFFSEEGFAPSFYKKVGLFFIVLGSIATGHHLVEVVTIELWK